ncbi:unnamed protein product [Meloidogyne enterolobii]|uniref:Uncharacterized protein n=1 Tax=Meloidogyne enterolobii TaxID=390850 RepID=A0ACB0ZAL6_MELEN
MSYKRRSRDYTPEEDRRHRNSSTETYGRSHDRHYSRSSNDRHYSRSSNYGGRFRHNDGRDNPSVSSCLGVFGMTKNTTEADLRRIFEYFGPVESVQIVYDRVYGDSKGFGFIYFRRTRDATEAREHMSDVKINGVRVRVDYSLTSYALGPK